MSMFGDTYPYLSSPPGSYLILREMYGFKSTTYVVDGVNGGAESYTIVGLYDPILVNASIFTL